MDGILFLIFAAIAAVCGLNVVVQRQPIASALSLIGVMGSLAMLYLLLGAQFIAAVQVIVYAGAVMVLFVMVIMLLNAGAERPTGASLVASTLGMPLLAGLLVALAYVVFAAFPDPEPVRFGEFRQGGAADVGYVLFTRYLLPFELTSVLVLIAIAGAVVLAWREVRK
ncbi:MAG: NADH-quinone oxidoreductase subunit J [Bryobacteraceae bacterium]